MINGRFSNFMEYHPVNWSAWFDSRLQIFDEMPTDGFTFTVFVGCEIDRAGVLHQAPELFDDLGPTLREFVGGLEVVINIDSQTLRGKVGDMAYRGLHFVLRSKK